MLRSNDEDDYYYPGPWASRELNYVNKFSGNLDIPDHITKVDSRACEDCYMLKNVTLPDRITEIGKRAFFCCDNMKSITIPDSVEKIGEQAFAYCSQLEQIKIPKKLSTIEKGTFYQCSQLRSIVIPENVIKIDHEAFAHCYWLHSVAILNPATVIDRDAFSCCSLDTVYVSPKHELTEEFKRKNIWWGGHPKFVHLTEEQMEQLTGKKQLSAGGANNGKKPTGAHNHHNQFPQGERVQHHFAEEREL